MNFDEYDSIYLRFLRQERPTNPFRQLFSPMSESVIPVQLARPKPVLRALVSIIGVCAVAVAAVTAASSVDWKDIIVSFDGRHNTFDMEVAGSAEPNWSPGESDWKQGKVSPVVIPIFDPSISPGESLSFRIAVRDSSPRLSAAITMRLVPPDMPNLLFDALRFTVSEGGQFYATDASPASLTAMAVKKQIAPGAYRLFTVSVSLPSDAQDSFSRMATPVHIQFTGESI